ncbi:hypothetical protein A6R70_14345 [Agrobacterium rubi]|uniref:DUF4376 domain-containing protein n=1 Tax=Agrobacterium rubi TaxID=28099 RepID=UPI00201B864A|nr:DUF4376 domain-containing protein [Agrobacterium rubi]MCL6653469.1 hypothetical protein [Agrobacterium rubi]
MWTVKAEDYTTAAQAAQAANEARRAAVDTERDRRIAAGFDWNGKHYQSRPEDIQNIDSMALAATSRIAQGQVDTGYRWFDADSDFAWIAADNSLAPMNIEDMMNFAMFAAKWKSDNIRAASAIKLTAGGIPENFATDARWPNASSG